MLKCYKIVQYFGLQNKRFVEVKRLVSEATESRLLRISIILCSGIIQPVGGIHINMTRCSISDEFCGRSSNGLLKSKTCQF